MNQVAERGVNYAVVLLVLVLGAFGTVVLIQQGIVSAATVARYGIWVLLGLIAVFALASGTKSKWDDIVVSYLLFLSIGGVIATYLINNGYITMGYAILGGLLLIFLLVLALYSKTGYKVTRAARFG